MIRQIPCFLKFWLLVDYRVERYDQVMKRVAIGLAVVSLGTLAGCGVSGQQPINHGMTATEVKSEVLARLQNWSSVEETTTEVLYPKHGARAVYHIHLVSQANPSRFALSVAPSNGPSYEVVDTGLNIDVYQSGQAHYSVETNDPRSWSEFRVLGTELPQVIKASRALSVDVKPKQVVLHMDSPIASNKWAHTTLWFSLVSNTPVRWQASWAGGTLEETPSSVIVNPTITGQTFAFNPPNGVTPEVSLGGAGNELSAVRSQVSFPILLPPASASLALAHVNVGRQHGSQVVLLTYETSQDVPVVITESKKNTFVPPDGVSLSKQTIGLVTAQVGSLPNGGEMAVFSQAKTFVVIEGPSNVVAAVLNAWGNQGTGIRMSPSTSSSATVTKTSPSF